MTSKESSSPKGLKSALQSVYKTSVYLHGQELEPVPQHSTVLSNENRKLRLFNKAIDDFSRVVVFFEKGNDVWKGKTSLQSISEDKKSLYIYSFRPNDLNKEIPFPIMGSVSVNTDSGKITFDSYFEELSVFDGEESYRVDMPNTPIFEQRRNSYRVHIKDARVGHVGCTIYAEPSGVESLSVGDLLNVSLTGFAAIFSIKDNMTKQMLSMLTKDKNQILSFSFSSEDEDFVSAVSIRNLEITAEKKIVLHGMFLNLSDSSQKFISAYLAEKQRQIAALESNH